MKSGLISKFVVFFSFLMLPAAGTLLHEAGHCLAAMIIGLDFTMHYNYTFVEINPLLENSSWHSFLVSSAGVISTISTGLSGYIILLRQRTVGYSIFFAFVAALFILRQLVAPFRHIIASLFNQEMIISDENAIARYLGVSDSIFMALLAAAAAIIFLHSILLFRRHPFAHNAIIFGPIAVTIGLFFWFRVLGPAILP